MRKPSFRSPTPADSESFQMLSGQPRLLVAGAVLLGMLLLAACITTSLLVFGRSQGILRSSTASTTTGSTTTQTSTQAAPKLSAPLTVQSARQLARRSPAKIVWMGLPVEGQVRWLTSIPAKTGVELAYIQGEQLAQFNTKNPTFTYLVQSANVTAGQAKAFLSNAAKSSSAPVAHIHGFDVVLPPSGSTLDRFYVVAPSQRVSAEIQLYAPVSSTAVLEALAAQLRVVP